MNPTAAHPTGNPEDEIGNMQITRATDPAQLEAGAVANFRSHDTDGWNIAGTVSRGPNGLVIPHLEVWSDNATAGITSRMLRSITLGNILSVVQSWLEFSEVEELRSSLDTMTGTLKRADKPEPERPGRAPLSAELLRQVAEGYLAETGPDKPRGAIKRLAAQLDKPEPTVSRWVVRARRDGWLGPATPGREGAEPGPLLREARAAELEAKLHRAANELRPPSS